SHRVVRSTNPRYEGGRSKGRHVPGRISQLHETEGLLSGACGRSVRCILDHSPPPHGASKLQHIAPVATSLGPCSEGSVPLRLRQSAPAGVLDIHAVCTPTEACWLNLIEAQFGVLKRFTLANTDDPDRVTR